jgi:hypothetical protein
MVPKMQLVQELWTGDYREYQPQLSFVEFLHVTTNACAPHAAAAISFVQQQRWQLLEKLRQLRQLGHVLPQSQQQLLLKLAAEEDPKFDHKQLQQKACRITRCKARSKPQLLQQVDDLQQQLQKFEVQLQGAELEALLTTAVARMHRSTVSALCVLPAAVELPSAAIVQLLQRCIVHKAPQRGVLTQLLWLAHVADKAAAAAASKAAAEVSATNSVVAADVEVLGRAGLPAMAQQLVLPPDQLTVLLQLAVQHRNKEAVQQLAVLPAAQQLDAAAMYQAASTAVELQDGSSLAALCELPCMQALPAQPVEDLLLRAVLYRSHACVFQLGRRLPAAARVSLEVFQTLCSTAVQAGAELLLKQLLRFPASQQLSVPDAEQLLDAAVKSTASAEEGAAGTRNAVLRVLSKHLPAASQISREALINLMRVAIVRRADINAEDTLLQLCELSPVADEMDAADVMALFETALGADSLWAMPLLCQLPVAQHLHPDDFEHMLRCAMMYRKPGADSVVQQICENLPGPAAELAPEKVSSKESNSAAWLLGDASWFGAVCMHGTTAAM